MPVKRRSYKSEVRTLAANETHARIVEAARELLSGGKNMPAFSLDAVARRAGVTRLTVYNRFESRRGLLEAVFDDTAQRGGLLELSSVMSNPNLEEALRKFVTVFCAFWAANGSLFSRIAANATLDEEIAESLHGRSERRRVLLNSLIRRLDLGDARKELVDVLFGLTSFDMHRHLAVGKRSNAEIEGLIHRSVVDTLKHYTQKPSNRRQLKTR